MWVQQVISAGSFGVHCTQAAEVKHKLIMHTASLRVRHQNVNMTQSSMLRYLCLRTLFDTLYDDYYRAADTTKITRKYSAGVKVPLCAMGDQPFASVRFQESILHPEARIARVELLDLLCDLLQLPRNRDSYTKLQELHYALGQKFIRSDGFTIWATHSKYSFDGSADNRYQRQRRDILFLKGSETDGQEIPSALCCEAVCFVTITQWESVQFPIPLHMRSSIVGGSLSLVLGRWFTPHRDAVQRDACLRPLAPGPLGINHCLWTYSQAPRSRRVLVNAQGVPTAAFRRQAHLFGRTADEQRHCLDREKYAYYALISPKSIARRANMCPTFIPGTSTPDTSTWLETVTMI